jgi:hypothetical protein
MVSGTRWTGSWVGPTASLYDVEKRKLLPLPGLELRPLGRPVSSQSLDRLRYPGSHFYYYFIIITLARYIRDFALFSVYPSCKNCPFARCASAANVVRRDVDVFGARNVLLNNIL